MKYGSDMGKKRGSWKSVKGTSGCNSVVSTHFMLGESRMGQAWAALVPLLCSVTDWGQLTESMALRHKHCVYVGGSNSLMAGGCQPTTFLAASPLPESVSDVPPWPLQILSHLKFKNF